MTLNIFVSYSHDDATLVTPIVKLLRVNRTLVFQDLDSIEAGKRWRDRVRRALFEAHLLVLFWCVHSSHSDEVESEYRTALEAGKDLLPVLLDATPLPVELSEFQWIDLRDAVGTAHGEAGAGLPTPAPDLANSDAPAPKQMHGALPAASAVTLLISLLSALLGVDNQTVSMLLLAAGVLGCLAVFLFLYLRTYVSKRHDAVSGGLPELQRQMAAVLEAEILRRAPEGCGEA